MGRTKISLRPYAQDALQLLGAQVRLARTQRRWTVAGLALRAGCSRGTIASIEQGQPQVSVGHLFNVCTVLGLPLFVDSPDELRRARRSRYEMLTLLPSRVVPEVEIDDDF